MHRYRKQGYSYCYVTQVDGMETGNLKVKLLEGRVGKVSITQVNSEGKPTGKIGNIPEHVILREIPFAVSHLSNHTVQIAFRNSHAGGRYLTRSLVCVSSLQSETVHEEHMSSFPPPDSYCVSPEHATTCNPVWAGQECNA